MASSIEIGVALMRLADTLPPPRGVSMDKAVDGYVLALLRFDAEDIDEAIRSFLAGEIPDVSTKCFPRAPELANIVRSVQAKKGHADKLKRASAGPPKPLHKTLFQRQWERWKAGEIKSMGEGIHDAVVARPVRPMAQADLWDRVNAKHRPRPPEQPPPQQDDFGGLA